MARVAKPHVDIKEACVKAAHKYIVKHGVEALSMREIARSVGVSHQAPYKHFANRDELLAEVMRRCFRAFADFLESRDPKDDAEEDLESLGERYLQYALRHPLEYRLMFAVTWPDVASGSELNSDATYAFDILRRALRRLYGPEVAERQIDMDSMYVWSSMHGLAMIMHSSVMDHIQLDTAAPQEVPEHVMQRICDALEYCRAGR
jgi:AcrR family transcriptional regulator